jgi:hypothetical protein
MIRPPDFIPRMRRITNAEVELLKASGDVDLIADPPNFLTMILLGEVEDYEILDYLENAMDNGVEEAGELWRFLKGY